MLNGINTNIYSIATQKNLLKAQARQVPATERMASGLRINSAKDDAVGLALSSKMDTEIRASHQMSKGINDGIGLLSVAQSGLNKVAELLHKARELAIQSANQSLGNSDRQILDQEYAKTLDEINRTSNTTELFGVYPLRDTTTTKLGDTSGIDQKYKNRNPINDLSGIKPMAFIPAGAKDIKIEIDSYSLDDDIQIFTKDGKHLVGTPIGDTTWNSQSVLSDADMKSKVFLKQNGFSDNANYDKSNLLDGHSSYTQPPLPSPPAPSSALSSSFNGMNFVYSGDGHPGGYTEEVLIDETTEPLMLMVVGVNSGRFQITVSWGSIPSDSANEPNRRTGPIHIPVGDSSSMGRAENTVTIEQTPSDTVTLGLSNTKLDSLAEATQAINALDAALETVNIYRGTHASAGSKLDSAIQHTMVNRGNREIARSKIMDADYAAETANNAAATILENFGLAMLAQANTVPNQIMKLLQAGG